MTEFTEFSDRYLDEANRLDPCIGAFRGDELYQTLLTDFSPAGVEARAAHARATLAELATVPLSGHGEEVAARFMAEVLEGVLAVDELGDTYREVRNLDSPAEMIRVCFEQMPQATAEDWEAIAERMERVPESIASLRAGLEEGRRRGLVAARRQAEAVVDQVAAWAGEAGVAPWFDDFVAQDGHGDASLRRRLDAAARAASEAYLGFRRYLSDDYLPATGGPDGVGPERHAAWTRWLLGGQIDAADAYAWGWAELRRIVEDRDKTAAQVVAGAGFAQARDHLVGGGGPVADGTDAYRDWLQDRIDEAIDWFDGVHLDIPPQLLRCEARLAPAGTMLAPYYTPPSNDFSIPGRTWWPTGTRTRFPLWEELTTAYHEAVPGHHLQIGWVRVLGDRLPSFQRFTESGSAHAEGWALYAERLMDELGRFEEPPFRLGFLTSQALRAVRVVLDIGLHHDLPIPADSWFAPGGRWTPELAVEFLEAETGMAHEVVVSEVVRYLGLPGQALAYKLGERAWLAGRAASRVRHGDGFDLKGFHTAALDLGILGLAQIEPELAAL
jgi:uncharacterized protein (DUF885 family)